ncbi:unnamed protein product [Moneuplotes crassus]|uniref:Uncharacterized protein n=1 Tax=Euplotes crassus TaxID=5936 RepID=A0AAD2D2R8_EUPCR|nr:unnamed protein product [Moneuplotes crassus]
MLRSILGRIPCCAYQKEEKIVENVNLDGSMSRVRSYSNLSEEPEVIKILSNQLEVFEVDDSETFHNEERNFSQEAKIIRHIVSQQNDIQNVLNSRDTLVFNPREREYYYMIPTGISDLVRKIEENKDEMPSNEVDTTILTSKLRSNGVLLHKEDFLFVPDDYWTTFCEYFQVKTIVRHFKKETLVSKKCTSAPPFRNHSKFNRKNYSEGEESSEEENEQILAKILDSEWKFKKDIVHKKLGDWDLTEELSDASP